MNASLPRYSLGTILKVRDKLYHEFKFKYAGLELDAGTLAAVLEDIQKLQPSLPTPALFETLRQHVGVKLELQFLHDLAWRLAGNTDKLKKNKPVLAWVYPGTVEWVPMQVMRVFPAAEFRGEPQCSVQFRVLAGSACPMLVTKLFVRRALSVIGRELGFTNGRGGRSMQRSEEMTGLRLYGKLEPEFARNGRPGFFEVRCPASLQDYNLAILKLRFRQGVDCPRRYRHECHACPVGYVECLGGVHRDTYISGDCVVCGTKSWFDPECGMGMCYVCHRREAMKKV